MSQSGWSFYKVQIRNLSVRSTKTFSLVNYLGRNRIESHGHNRLAIAVVYCQYSSSDLIWRVAGRRCPAWIEAICSGDSGWRLNRLYTTYDDAGIAFCLISIPRWSCDGRARQLMRNIVWQMHKTSTTRSSPFVFHVRDHLMVRRRPSRHALPQRQHTDCSRRMCVITPNN